MDKKGRMVGQEGYRLHVSPYKRNFDLSESQWQLVVHDTIRNSSVSFDLSEQALREIINYIGLQLVQEQEAREALREGGEDGS